MTQFLRVLELSEKLHVSTDDIIAVCILLDIPASSRISSLNDEQVRKLTKFYKEKG